MAKSKFYQSTEISDSIVNLAAVYKYHFIDFSEHFEKLSVTPDHATLLPVSCSAGQWAERNWADYRDHERPIFHLPHREENRLVLEFFEALVNGRTGKRGRPRYGRGKWRFRAESGTSECEYLAQAAAHEQQDEAIIAARAAGLLKLDPELSRAEAARRAFVGWWEGLALAREKIEREIADGLITREEARADLELTAPPSFHTWPDERETWDPRTGEKVTLTAQEAWEKHRRIPRALQNALIDKITQILDFAKTGAPRLQDHGFSTWFARDAGLCKGSDNSA